MGLGCPDLTCPGWHDNSNHLMYISNFRAGTQASPPVLKGLIWNVISSGVEGRQMSSLCHSIWFQRKVSTGSSQFYWFFSQLSRFPKYSVRFSSISWCYVNKVYKLLISNLTYTLYYLIIFTIGKINIYIFFYTYILSRKDKSYIHLYNCFLFS